MTFSKMGFRFSEEDVDSIINCKPLAIENALRILKVKIEMYIKQKHEQRGNSYTMQLQEAPVNIPSHGTGVNLHPIQHNGELPQIHAKGGHKAAIKHKVGS